MKKYFIIICCLLATTSLWADDYDFSARSNGKALYYKYNNGSNGTSVSVVYPNYDEYNDNVYSNYTQPTGNLTIPASVTNGGKTYSVTSIGEYAFYNCSGLTSVTIPNSVTSIGSVAFASCSNLTAINVNESNATYKSIDGVLYKLYNKYNNTTTLICYPGGKTGDYTIPNSVISIGEYAFYDCSGLTSVTIPTSVVRIEEGALYGCIGLTSVTIPNSVTSIGEYAFSHCTGLTSVTIPNSVKSIESEAFAMCTRLAAVTIPNSVTSIGSSAFAGCSNLTAINVNESNATYKSIDGVLYNKSTTKLVCCPGGKTGDYTIPNSVTSIESGAFAFCSGLTSVTIPTSVTSIGDLAFAKCTGLTSITIPNSVTSIGMKAFANCTRLAAVTIPNSVTSIGEQAFAICSSLTSVTIPKSVTSIGDYAFANCIGITSITCEGVTPSTITEKTFYNLYNIPLYVPDKSIRAYKEHEIWGKFTNISAIPITYTIIVLANNTNIGSPIGSGTFEEGSTATISAIPTEGYNFVSWNDGNTENPRLITVTENATYIATFAAEGTNTYTVSAIANNASMGNVNEGGTYTENTIISLYATPNQGYCFVCWNDGNTQNPRTIIVTENKTYTAQFNSLYFYISVKSNNSNYGTVWGEDIYAYQEVATIAALPNNGYVFTKWNDGNTTNPRQITVNSDATYTATFAKQEATNAIAEANSSNAQILSGERRIIINNAENAIIAIYDVTGRTVVKEQRLNTNNEVFAVLETGLYLVRINNTAKKILVK